MKTYKIRDSQCPIHKHGKSKQFGGIPSTVEIDLGNGFWLCVACPQIRQDEKEGN